MTAAEMARLHANAFTMPRPWTEAEIAARLADPFGIAVTESTGFLLGRIVANEAELLTLAVDSAARRQGTGERLVERFVTQVAARGALQVFLEVAEINTAARALYEKQGFLQCGRRKGYYMDGGGQGVAALVLRRQISATDGTG